jgi:hypothetical protein
VEDSSFLGIEVVICHYQHDRGNIGARCDEGCHGFVGIDCKFVCGIDDFLPPSAAHHHQRQNKETTEENGNAEAAIIGCFDFGADEGYIGLKDACAEGLSSCHFAYCLEAFGLNHEGHLVS